MNVSAELMKANESAMGVVNPKVQRLILQGFPFFAQLVDYIRSDDVVGRSAPFCGPSHCFSVQPPV